MKYASDKIDLKVFQLNSSFYLFKDQSPEQIIEIIKNNHLKKLHSKFDNEDLSNLNSNLTHSVDEEFQLWTYSYNQPKSQYYWKLFLPDKLTKEHNFKISEFSFVLFILYKSEIYCVIGGSGMSVIRKFVNPNFGIDLYQHFAKPNEDVVIELNARGIASNISQKKHTFNLNQTISETLDYSEVPNKIKLILRRDLKKGIFKKYKLGSDRTVLEVGSYFHLRKKINFVELKTLIIDLHTIYNDKNFTQITLFRKIDNDKLIKELDNHLQSKVVEDIINFAPTIKSNVQKDVLEVVHPTSLERFYECDNYIIKAKYSRGKEDVVVANRDDLYVSCVEHLFRNVEDRTNRFKIAQSLYTLNIIGCVNNKELTFANFYDHLIAEIEYQNKRYFRIDTHWYYLKDEFIKQMNIDAVQYYKTYELKDNILNSWPEGVDEDFYNQSHSSKDYFVLDKVIKENIEICDILVIKDNKAYFVHVKNGFNTKIRDLYIQVILSAKRLSNDLKNNDGSSYLKKTLKAYKRRTKSKSINIKNIVDRIFNSELEIVFVMAFKNNYRKTKKPSEKINLSKSNIAKYSIVQTVKEMQRLNFQIRILDIADIK